DDRIRRPGGEGDVPHERQRLIGREPPEPLGDLGAVEDARERFRSAGLPLATDAGPTAAAEVRAEHDGNDQPAHRRLRKKAGSHALVRAQRKVKVAYRDAPRNLLPGRILGSLADP